MELLNINRPLGAGMDRPKSLAVSTHSLAIFSALDSASTGVLPSACSREVRDFGYKRLVFIAPVNNHLVFKHPLNLPIGS